MLLTWRRQERIQRFMAMRTGDSSKAVPVESEGSRAASYVAELREFFAGRGMKSGSPEDLTAFATALREPGTFADELGSLMRSILYRERGAIALPHLLEIMTEAMGGARIAQVSEQVREPIREFLPFLTTVMRKSRAPMPIETSSPQVGSELGAEETISPASSPSSTGDGPSTETLPTGIAEPDSAPVSLPISNSKASQNLYTRAQELTPAVARPQVTIETDQQPKRDGTATGGVPAGEPYLPLQPQATNKNQPFNPPERKGQSNQRRNAIAISALSGLGLILALVFAGKASRVAKAPAENPAIVTGGQVQMQSRQSRPSRDSAASQSSRSTPLTNTPGQEPAPAGSVLVEGPNAQTEVDRGGSGDPKPSAAELIDGNRQNSQDSSGFDGSQGSASQSAAGDGRSTVRTNKSSAMRVVPGRRRGVYAVSSGVMAANLISAPAPKYPRLAGIFHVEGQVILQAVVSRNGRVAVTHVLRGHRLLRGAAENAVRQWRYRPFLVNGQPTDVATIVTVNFRQR